MSIETESPVKKSILTVAMEAAQAKKAARADKTDENDPVASYEKKKLRNAVLAVAAICTATFVAVKLVSNMAEVEDETTDEAAPSED
jgi:hypothetical protein